MLAATHAVTGAIIASQVQNPAAALAAAALSHPLFDLFPHWDFNSRWAKRSYARIFALSAFDAILGFSLGFILFGNSVDWKFLLLIMLVAQWTDWLEAPYHFGYKIPPFTWIKKLQHFWHTKLAFPWGLLPQLGILGLAVYLSLN